MKKTFKIIGIVVGIHIVLALALTAFHRISLSVEQERIVPNGRLVEVNGYQMHVFIDGENEDTPLLVFLAGFGTTAPVYDFKPIYSQLSGEFRIAVVERFGYGYSDIADRPRDIDTVLSETRAALSLIGETGPYVLFPHSMSGLEAIRWAQLYPEEVIGIVGIDMAVPSFYLENENALASEAIRQRIQSIFTSGLGVHRFFGSVNIPTLTATERTQATLLSRRNAINSTMVSEARIVVDNARTITQASTPSVPILLLVSNEQGNAMPAWLAHASDFATQSGGQIEFFDAGHFLHHYEPEQIAVLSKEFIGIIV